jgi:hypothetical protein
MDFNATIDLIIRDLDEAREIIDDLKKIPGVPVLQVELAKSKCKTAGEVIALLKTLHIKFTSEEKIEQVTGEPVKRKFPVSKSVSNEKPETIIPPPVIKKKLPYQPSKESSETAIIADKFTQSSTSLNEQMGNGKTDEYLSDVLKTKPITTLSEAIGLNDRFLFIREIFNSNKDEYYQAIQRLDNVVNLEDAKAIIMSFTGENNETEAVIQLLALVKRKLSINE